ncbi:MAG TPA: universal stress protein [Candidatus Angelobacter sp.]
MSASVVVPILPAIQLKRVLYATDFSEGSKAALPLVCAIARRYNSELFVAHICEPLPYVMATPEAVSVLERRDQRHAREKLAGLLRAADAFELSTKTIVQTGDPIKHLQEIVREKSIDLAVLSTHGRVGLKHLVLGSVAEALFRHLPCPVLTVGPHLAHRFLGRFEIRRILFPTDLSEESRAVFPYLASLAHEYSAAITALHVLPPETAGNPDARMLAEPLRKEMMRIFSPEISPRCNAEFLIDSGDASERILAHAEEPDVDLIGFGIRKAGEIATHFRNTVTYRVLLNAKCPVLTHRFQHQWTAE